MWSVGSAMGIQNKWRSVMGREWGRLSGLVLEVQTLIMAFGTGLVCQVRSIKDTYDLQKEGKQKIITKMFVGTVDIFNLKIILLVKS